MKTQILESSYDDSKLFIALETGGNNGMQDFLSSRRAFLTGSVSTALAGLSTTSWPAAEGLEARDALRVQKLAWAGVRLQTDESTLFIDPLINRDVWGSALPDPMIPVDVERGDRFVLVTHRHPDHFDALAVRKIVGDSGVLVCDSDVAPLAAGQGFKVRLASIYEPMLLGNFTATAVPAMDGYGDPQVSWVVSAGGRRILHCGDTLWHGYWWRIGRQFGRWMPRSCQSMAQDSNSASHGAMSRP